MKAWSGEAGTVKRLAVGAVAGMAVVSLLGACTAVTHQQAAAVVNGQVIRLSEVEQTADQLRSANLDFSEQVVVTALIAAPLLAETVQASGSWKPDATYASVINAMPDATATTKAFVSTVALLQSAQMTSEDVAHYRSDLKQATIAVNPRFGTLVPTEQGPVYFTLGAATPNWIASAPQTK
ncbi:MAG: hypothetical protein L0H79_07120 [Intrasporangium sp.]|uniref:hypothetical protein n=1 Tax=Intrasporangium sp. TaxID=1925024 RepID=UPI002647FBEE|nr:hypothetical protein [Intrasporangium sp.]MDN5795509.1 hypothetical protein [Intrasporangium sp.]